MIRVYNVTLPNGTSSWRWLCEEHAKARRDENPKPGAWQRDGLTCDDCEDEKR